MRLLTHEHGGRLRPAVVTGDGRGVVDLDERLGVTSLDELFARERLDEARPLVGLEPDHPLEAVSHRRVLTWPRKIFCIGVNYRGRNAEYRDDSTEPAHPSVFIRYPDSLVGHDEALVRPPESHQLDYEGEIAVVIGRGGRRIPVETALEHIAAVTLANEGTIRDWVRHAKFNVTQGKNWERSGSLGPWLVTVDELGGPDALTDLEITTRVGGEVRQHDSTATMRFPIARIVAYLSTFTPLAPGDVVLTGTPTGAGARFDPPRWLVPGDVVEVEAPGIGTLRNTVVDEAAP